MIGQTISHYTILEKLGEGGMGVVYKALDTKLNREVALKFLPPHISKGGIERDRFLQEAQAAAAINHPNICVIYEINDGGEQPYIAMEYVDGSTIRTKLESGPMKKDDAIKYGIQIGEALHEAHSKGIVHRDIKADNIIINTKGQAKVMDFGLAKLKGSLKLTKTSSTVGTLGYMAPEQIQGGEVDARSDIFGFGVLFFEMLTGRLPFRGEHEAAMVYSIVNEDPESIEKLIPEINPEISHTIGKALEKDPDERYQSIQDMVVDLRRSKKDSTRVSRTAERLQKNERTVQQSTAEKNAPARFNIKMIGYISVPIILLVIAYFTLFNATVHINSDLKFRKLQVPFSQVSYPSLSADGKWTAFAAAEMNGKWDIYYMHTGDGIPKRVTYDSSSFIQQSSEISPDGSKITYNYFNNSKQRLEAMVISVQGGNAKMVAVNSALQRWKPDGIRIGYVQFRNPKNAFYSLWSVKADGSDNKLEFADSITVSGRFSFCWSPDGNSIAWIRSFNGAFQEVITKNLVNGDEKQITHEKSNIDDVCWLKNDIILYSSNKNGNSNLWMIPNDGGESQQVTSGTNTDLGISASSDGKTVLYYQLLRNSKIWMGDFMTRTSKQITFDDRQIDGVCLEPNGTHIAYLSTISDGDISEGNELFLMDRNGSNRQQITNGKHTLFNFLWSPEGKYVGYTQHLFNDPSDSINLVILESSNSSSPIFTLHGVSGFQWVDDKSLIVRGPSLNQNNLFSLDTKIKVPLYEDSTFASLVRSKTMIVFFDQRQGRQGLYIRGIGYTTNPDKYPAKKFLNDEQFQSMNFVEYHDQYFYWTDINNRFYRKSYETGVIENLSGNYPGLDPSSFISISPNNKEFVYAAQQVNGKFILIENIFK